MAPIPASPACASTQLDHAVVDVQLPGNGTNRSLLGMIVQDLRLDLRQCHHDVRVPSGRVQHGRDDAGGRAETPDGATAGSSDRTSGSANPRVAAGQQRKRYRAGASSRPAPETSAAGAGES